MTVNIYNSLTRTKQKLEPLEPGHVRMYVCGMTVYDYCHIGHARVLVVFDMVARYLRARGYRVTYVRNITDIDDKIIKRAAEHGEDIDQLTGRFIDAMHEDARALGVLPPDHEPRATGNIGPIMDMIQALLNRGIAYVAGNGDVYYRVRAFPTYGRLSGKTLDELQVGARVEADEAKNDPLDFVLWKAHKPGEPSWEAPWGPGRPGWHIECSAMSTRCLGNHFDIHGGGADLQFPHHENEIAQSEAATGEPFVNIWMHNGFVRVNEEKMSKSLGNFFTIRDVLKSYDPEVIRYFILASHYRSPLNYSDATLDNARAGLTRLYTALVDLQPVEVHEEENEFAQRFWTAMDDDFNTPVAMAALFDLAREINRLRGQDQPAAARHGAVLRRLGGMLGLLGRAPGEFLRGTPAVLAEAEIERLIDARLAARKNRQWAEADRIRDELKAQGIVLEDGQGRTTWRRA